VSKKARLGIIIMCCAFTITVYAQHINMKPFKKFSAGIDVVNTLTFLKKNSESYLLNYRYEVSKNKSLRLGVNLEISDGESSGYYPDFKFGIQQNNKSDNWNLYYGIDASYSYFKSTSNPTSNTRLGGSAFLGVEYYFNKHISIITEESLNYYHYNQYNPESFEIEKRKTYYRLVLGSVGMVVIMYHF
jgi:hypothetical protein